MIIQVHMVPEDHPFSISFVIPPEVMNATQGYSFTTQIFETPIKCDVKLRRMEEDIYIQADISGSISPDCDRCLGTFDLLIKKDVALTCQAIGKGSVAPDEDGDLYYFQGNELDLTPIMREIVLLDMPIRNLCDESCEGLCGQCGSNLNEESHGVNCEKSIIFPQKVLHL